MILIKNDWINLRRPDYEMSVVQKIEPDVIAVFGVPAQHPGYSYS